ncbi:glucose PTS transporter subunit IIA [Enterococcus mundtii]|uniref:PTS beta-glucoside transporter subunit EIIBCA n=1 Tax=Enterococcus mundtii TaxID=53346 RepID=A0ABQ0VFH8_ENTMU|nr:glucose PTS transporter subunit IIA [Enterococcus mundtii]GEN19777.1 PTS beta-glucoside transporter subunit EIIBCA [Ligilactobacillus acidipiscis]AUB53417.1 PTS beta-glucoside transporter subunit EIIBCA [Enterococcus mundtii]MDB7088733.1 glucose PTS transporter subunit IIA [Enterococcus mundtii]MZZ58430.1 PTS transporter subunit EIIC [Enterococcus mundtii]MZZ61696.1 PTS transporter subunit EIIC [Enterococcus mundtii]
MAKNELTLTELAKQIYAGAGGMGNVDSVVHCMTRVRMKVIDESLVDVAKLKAIPGVLGVVEDEQLQVIIGPGKVNKVAQEMVDQAGVKLGEKIPGNPNVTTGLSGKDKVNERAQEMKKVQKSKQKPSKIKSILKDISNIFVPMIPAFVGTGIVAGIAAVLTNLVTAGTIDGASWQQYIDIMNILKNGMFSYLVIYTGINAAQVFGATPTLGGVIGAVVMLTGMNPEAPLTNLFTGTPLAAGQGGIIGVIFAVWLLSIVEKKLHKIVPDAVDIIVTPTLSLIAIGLIEIFLIMPLAGFISDGMVGGINWVLSVGGAFSGFVLGTLFLPMVMFGLHQILTPIHVQMIDETGRTLLLPILAMAGAGQVGAALALWVRCKKDKELTEMIKGALPVGILGIGEPLIYGVTLPLGRPFITACIGGGIGGAVIGLIGNIGAIAIGPSGAALIPLISDGKWFGYVLGLLAAYAGGFLATFFFGIPKEQLAKEELAEEAPVYTASSTDSTNQTQAVQLCAVADGTVQSIEQASDPVFAQKMMGEGYFVEPTNGHIYAPTSGIISSIFPTKHAIGLTTADGLELLIHMGVNTVELGGTPFDIKVSEGQAVTKDTMIADVDLAAIKEAGKETAMMVLLTNMEHVLTFVLTHTGEVRAKTPVMDVESVK